MSFYNSINCSVSMNTVLCIRSYRICGDLKSASKLWLRDGKKTTVTIKFAKRCCGLVVKDILSASLQIYHHTCKFQTVITTVKVVCKICLMLYVFFYQIPWPELNMLFGGSVSEIFFSLCVSLCFWRHY